MDYYGRLGRIRKSKQSPRQRFGTGGDVGLEKDEGRGRKGNKRLKGERNNGPASPWMYRIITAIRTQQLSSD